MNDVFDWSAYFACFTCSAIWNSLICISSFAYVDFPESTPAVEDLKFCLERTNQRQQLLTSLKSAFETRLLHPGQHQVSGKKKKDALSLKKKMVNLKILFSIAGVHTSDIITVYISAIKALRELDPSMVILQVACQPIRKYLRLGKTLYLYHTVNTNTFFFILWALFIYLGHTFENIP